VCVSVGVRLSVYVVSGITNTAGRIVAGFLADLRGVNALLLHNASLVGAGLLCFANMFCRELVSMSFFAALFGLCIGPFYSIIAMF